jgi:predicted enzyme related to lactoylglutathione lyase
MRLWSNVGMAAMAASCVLGCAGSTPVASETPAAVKSESSKSESSHEVTIGVPVPDLNAAVAWYTKLLGREVESLKPTEGVVELRIAPGAWLQLFAVETKPFQPTTSVLRLKTSQIDNEASRLAAAGVKVGEITRVPEVVAFCEFADPYGNPVGLYQVMAPD